jgi:AraC-like DNA-binding protein
VGGHIRSLARWAHAFGLAPGTVSRGFRQTYGVSPKRYRAEARAHRAWTALKGNERLSQLALSQGFADQSHMTRAVTALTGFPPSHWRGGEK